MRSVRLTRYHDNTPCGSAIYFTADDLERLGIDPVTVGVVDIFIEDGQLVLEPGEGEPFIIDRPSFIDPQN